MRPPCEMIRHDTMKEILRQAINDDDQETSNIVSTIQPSRVDGFLTGLNVLLQGRRGHYHVSSNVRANRSKLYFSGGWCS